MKSSFIHFGIALALCLVALVGYGTWYAVIATTSTAAAELQNRIITRNETANRVALARSALIEIAADEVAVRGHFVPETDVVAFINNLEARGLAQGSSVNVLSVEKGGIPTHQTLNLTLTVKGSFDAVMRTVGTIEYAPYDLSISQFSLARGDKNNWHADFKLLVGSISASATAKTP